MTAIDDLLKALREAKEKWRGCEWPTEFGRRSLNLEGLRSRQAAIAAKATRGDEAECWSEAAEWLEIVERDAESAAGLGTDAIEAVRRGEFDLALRELSQAILLQQQYPMSLLYLQLRNAIERYRDELIEHGQNEPA